MSSCNDCIKFSLNIKDPLLEFFDISTGKYRNRKAKFYHAIVHLDHCLNCGSANIVHNGHLYSNVRYPALDDSQNLYTENFNEKYFLHIQIASAEPANGSFFRMHDKKRDNQN